MIESVTDFIRKDDNSALLLVDIGVWAFRNILKEYPERVKNIGIFEDGMISVAAGLSLQGIVPTIYGITPFIVERAYNNRRSLRFFDTWLFSFLCGGHKSVKGSK